MLEKCVRWALLALVLWLGSNESARADSCVAVVADVIFATVSPIAASGGTSEAPRTMAVIGTCLPYNLYLDENLSQ